MFIIVAYFCRIVKKKKTEKDNKGPQLREPLFVRQ